MAYARRVARHVMPRSFGHDISIPVASRALKRALVAGVSAVVLVWVGALASGCSTTAGSDASGIGGNAGAGGASPGDGPILTTCPAVEPAAGAACAGSLFCEYGQQRCCDHFEPVSAANCQSGRIVISPWESACLLGYVCPTDGGSSDAADGAAPDAGVCCTPDPVVTGCMNLGGYSTQGCFVTCDFFCSTNWRMENDSHGCAIWRYDTRAPAPGEGPTCFPLPDGGSRVDARDQ